MSLSNEVLKWGYVNIIHVVAVKMQMGITTSQKMLLIFEMEGVFFQSYTKDEQDFHIQKEPDWKFGDDELCDALEFDLIKHALDENYL